MLNAIKHRRAQIDTALTSNFTNTIDSTSRGNTNFNYILHIFIFRKMINKWILKILICQLYLRVALAELKLVQAVFRHGNRMPTKEKYYPDDPYAKYTYEPEGPGGLTNVRYFCFFYKHARLIIYVI